MTLQLVTRAQWGAKPPTRRSTASMSGPTSAHWNGPTVLVGGKTTWTHDRCAALVRGIQDFHMKPVSQGGRGWSDIAYNFLECPHGYTFEGRGLNVINGANGTNTGNQTAHAICSLAGQGNPHPMAEKVGFKAAVKYIADRTAAPNRANGHRDHKATECPGNDRYNWVHAGMPITVAVEPTPQEPADVPIFATDPEANHFVVTSYQRLAERTPSKDEAAAWVWQIRSNGERFAFELLTNLNVEARALAQGRLNKALSRIATAEGKIQVIEGRLVDAEGKILDLSKVDLSDVERDQILAEVWADLTTRLAPRS